MTTIEGTTRAGGVSTTFSASEMSAPTALTPALPEPSTGGDLELAIATLAIQTQHDRQKTARAQRDATEVAIDSANRAELAEMQKSADLKYDAAMLKGVSSIVGGALTIGAQAAPPLGQAMRNAPLAEAVKFADGSEKLRDGITTTASAGMDRAATRADVRARAAAQSAQKLTKLAGDAADEEKQARADGSKALDLLRQYKEAVAQTSRAALYRA